MKFMKLGSKPDSFENDGNSVRYVATDLASDVVITVGDVKFYLHKFPLSSKSARLAKLVASTNDEIDLHEIPGGPIAFEICAKFCYGVTVTLNSYNVVAARCAAEYLEMHETIEKGNLIYKIDVFLSSSIFRGWKDSVIVLQTSKPLLPLSEDLKLVSRCIDAIASKASVDTSQVDWSYSYNRKKLSEENARYNLVPRDWWVEDLCELDEDLFKRVISKIRNRGFVPCEVIGEALKAYIVKRLPGLNKGMFQCGDSHDMLKARSVLETIVWLLPSEKGVVSCSFLLKLLKASILVGTGEMAKNELIRRIGHQMEEARPSDLLIQAEDGEDILYDVGTVEKILQEFMMQDQNGDEIQEMGNSGILTEASKLMVAKLIDGYLAEISKDPNLPLSTFVDVAEMVSDVPRPSHDGLYRAIDMYLKEHPGITKSERKRISRLMDCKKLSVEACTHAVQNERLPMRVVMQVLYFEQVRAAASSGSSTPDLPKGFKDLNGGSHRSSRSTTTNTDEDWDAVATAEELKALKAEVAALRLGKDKSGNDVDVKGNMGSKMKGLITSQRIFSKIWSRNSCTDDHSGSDSVDSHGSGNP